MNSEKRNQLVKKLLYQSCNRGCKETDLILGEFAKKHLFSMTDEELSLFTKILQLNDTDIYDWYTQKKPVPKTVATSVMISLMNFNPQR